MALWRAIGNKVKSSGRPSTGWRRRPPGADGGDYGHGRSRIRGTLIRKALRRAARPIFGHRRPARRPSTKTWTMPPIRGCAPSRWRAETEALAAMHPAAPAPAPSKKRGPPAPGSAADPLDLCLSSDDEKEDKRWPCSACTFSNDSKRTTCEICATPRSRRSTGSSVAVPRRSSASSTSSSPSTTRYAFSVSANTGRVSAFSSREGAPFARLMDAFDPAVLVDGEGRLLPLSADDLGLDDDDDARAVKKFVAAWRSLRAVDRQTLSGDELLEEALDVELRKRRRASSDDKCFDRGVARPRKRARADGDEDDDKSVPLVREAAAARKRRTVLFVIGPALRASVRKPQLPGLEVAALRARTRRLHGLWFGRARFVQTGQSIDAAERFRCSWRRRACPARQEGPPIRHVPRVRLLAGRPHVVPVAEGGAAVVWTTSATLARRATKKKRTRCASARRAEERGGAAGTRTWRSLFLPSGACACSDNWWYVASMLQLRLYFTRCTRARDPLPAVFFPPSEEPQGRSALGEACGGRGRSVTLSCSARHTLARRSPPHPPIVQPGLGTADPILRSAQPPAACPRPQLPTSPKIGAARPPKAPP